MASSLLRFTTSVVRFRPPLSITACAYRLPRQHSENKTSSFCSPADNSVPYMPFDLTYLKTQMEISGVPSILFTMDKGEELTVNVPGIEKTVTDEGPCVSLHTSGALKRGIQGVGFDTVVADNNLLIQVKTDEEIYLAGVKLPQNFDRNGRYNVVFTGEMLKLTLPMLKNTHIMPDFVDNTVARATPYCVMFDRADLGQKLCGLIANLSFKSKSFTLYKKDTAESIYMKRTLPGVEKMVVTKEGLCVSLNMPGFEIEDVESVFEYDALVIEGRRGNEHYIAGVRVPEGFHWECNMIKREMRDGVYKATLPHVDVKRRAFSVYR